MSLQSIPAEWCNAVYTVIRTSDSRAIRYTADAWARFEATFPDAFRSELQGAFMAVLRPCNLQGCPVQMNSPPGETWEFYFTFRRHRLYGKILLRPDRKSVVIFSAHPPRKPKLFCE